MKKMMSFGISVCCLWLGAVSTQAAEVDAVRVVVGETVITDLDINRLADMMLLQGRIQSAQQQEPGFRSGLVQLSIQRELIKQAAPLSSDEQLPTEALQQSFLDASHIAAGDLSRQLAAHQLTDSDLEQYLKDEYHIQKNQGQYLHSKVQFTTSDITRYSKQYRHAHTRYHLVDFYIPKSDKPPTASRFKAHMEGARSQYKAGSPVQAPVVAVDLGSRTLDGLPDLYQQVVPQLEVDALSYMVVAENGYHALFLLEKDTPAALSKEQVKQQLFSEQASHVLSTWLDELKSSTFVKIYP